METEFEPLPDGSGTDETAANSSKTEAEVLYDMAEATNNKIDNCVTKLGYLVEMVDKLVAASDSATPPTTPTTDGSTRAG